MKTNSLLTFWAGTLTLLTLGCGSESQDQQLGAPLGWTKGDSLMNQCSQEIHQNSSDITVLKVKALGRVTPKDWMPEGKFTLDCSKCEVLKEKPSTHDQCNQPGYEECKVLDLDCRAELEQMTQLSFLSPATFDSVWYTKYVYPASGGFDPAKAGTTEERYNSQYIDCNIFEITTVSRSAALPTAKSIGFFFRGKFSEVPLENLTSVGTVTLKNGEEGTLHTFGGLAVCWTGTMSSSMRSKYEFKPFLRFVDQDTCYLNWDSVPTNYIVSSDVSSFDRSAEILQ